MHYIKEKDKQRKQYIDKDNPIIDDVISGVVDQDNMNSQNRKYNIYHDDSWDKIIQQVKAIRAKRKQDKLSCK